MVVLDKSEMLTIGNNQYLQPDYLAPSNSVIDSKKSPLALLAQTCSQIGADSSSLKPIVLDKSNKQKSETSRSPSGINNNNNNNNNNNSLMKNSEKMNNNNNNGSPELKLAFKPYEANVLTRKLSNNNAQDETRPSSKNSVNGNNNNEQDNVKNLSMKNNRVPSRNSSDSPINGNHNNKNNSVIDVVENGKSTPGSNSGDRKSGSPVEKGASPIIRSGMEVLHGSPKDYNAYKNALGMSHLGLYPGMEANPAFRNPYAGISHHHAAMLAAAAGYSQAQAQQTPFMSYARVKTPSGGEALVPVCKDPYCTGCQYSAHNQQLLMGQPCPAGCTQCEHQKIGLAMAMSSLPPGHPYASAMNRQPYVCSWIMGGSYCGKRFETSDELFSHLRSHSPSLADPASAAATLAAQQNAALMNPLSSLYRAYSNPQLSPLSAARYHPYAKPGSLQPTFTAGSPYSAFNPAALGPYAAYSPYAAAALYSQRMGAAHP
uniref:CSON013548 protein n=2 Tax=Culicoides sonorensis TaxID=179676 RepID=A0A336M895_CULSO